MNKSLNWFTTILSVFIGITVTGQPSQPSNNKSLLWSITGHNLKKPSYLFGTIHLICVDDYLWTPKMKECLNKSDNVCFELNLADPTVMAQVATGLMDSSGKSLEDYFTQYQFKLLKKYINDSLGMNISMFNNMKPIALQSIFSASGLNCTNPTSYEDSIMKTAQKAGKQISGLEDPAEQIAALEKIPIDSVVVQLMDEMQNNQKNDSEYNNLIAAYKSQDLPLLYQLITTSSEPGDEMGVLLEDRNKKWISRMSNKMNKSSVFFAVGAGHLWGDMGVITLLRKAGYTVKPLK